MVYRNRDCRIPSVTEVNSSLPRKGAGSLNCRLGGREGRSECDNPNNSDDVAQSCSRPILRQNRQIRSMLDNPKRRNPPEDLRPPGDLVWPGSVASGKNHDRYDQTPIISLSLSRTGKIRLID